MLPPRTRKRGHAGGGGGGGGAEAILDDVGLGGFARLDLTPPLPDELEQLELAAAYDHGSGCILVALDHASGRVAVSASPADVAAALALQLGPVAEAEVDAGASVFSSEEAIAAVREFVCDRVLLGGGGGVLPEEAAVALRLVEEGKARAVGWGWLFWALLKWDVMTGKARRYAPHLRRLVACQRPELYAELDGSLPLGKRRKDMPNQSIGDLEDMPVFGESKGFAAVIPVDCKTSSVEEGGWIHEMDVGNSELCPKKRLCSDADILGREIEGDQGKDSDDGNTKDQSSAYDPPFLGLLRSMYEQDDSSSLQRVVFGTKSLPKSNQQHVIEIEDEDGNDDDEKDNVGVGPGSAVLRNGPFDHLHYLEQQKRATEGIQNYQTLSPFSACMQQLKGYVPNMEKAFLDIEKEIRENRADIERMKNTLKEKDYIIASLKRDILEELEARTPMIRRLKYDQKLMLSALQQNRQKCKDSYAAFLEYRKKVSRREATASSLEVSGIADSQNQTLLRQKLYIYQKICGFQKLWLSKYSEMAERITQLPKHMMHLTDELRRLKVPDLNKGGEDESLDNELFGATAAQLDDLTAQRRDTNDNDGMVVP